MITDLETLVCDYSDEKIWCVYRHKVFTPYEMENKWEIQPTDEYLGDYRIQHLVELPNKDVLLGMRLVTINYVENKLEFSDKVEYYKLSDLSFIVDVTDSEEYASIR